ncbi:MAG: hypothetical protein IJ163_07795 [Bacteroidaceae bacterium]|nr:hypothetical protein [Bacteroidaceae bacterium]
MNNHDRLNPNVLNNLRYYYEKAGLEKKTGRQFEEMTYKAEEVFARSGAGQVCDWHLDVLEEYFGIPVYEYLLEHQQYYMEGCKYQPTKSALKKYLKTPFFRNRTPKIDIDTLLSMVSAMR